MVKKINIEKTKKTKNEKKILVKYFVEKGYSNHAISKETKIPRSTVIRLKKEIENEKNGIFKEKVERTKLPKKYYKKIVNLATNKKTSEMPGGRIAEKINDILKKNKVYDKKQNLLSITGGQVNRILKKN